MKKLVHFLWSVLINNFDFLCACTCMVKSLSQNYLKWLTLWYPREHHLTDVLSAFSSRLMFIWKQKDKSFKTQQSHVSCSPENNNWPKRGKYEFLFRLQFPWENIPLRRNELTSSLSFLPEGKTFPKNNPWFTRSRSTWA